MAEDEVIELFRADLAQAVIEDPYQRELYERQGAQQLRDFLAIAKRSATPRVLHTEERFEVQLGHDHGGGPDRPDRRPAATGG